MVLINARMLLIWNLIILDDEIVSRYFEILQTDKNNKPQQIQQFDFGIKYFMNPTSIYSNEGREDGFVDTPPRVSIPRDKGVTSRSNTSVTSPARTAPCNAAPTATASSGLIFFASSLPLKKSETLKYLSLYLKAEYVCFE